MKFSTILGEHEINGNVVNPGEWFGDVFIIQVDSIYVAVEAENAQAAIDALCDSEEWGHLIRVTEEDALVGYGCEENIIRAGNASEPVDLTYCQVYGHDNRSSDCSPYEKERGFPVFYHCKDNQGNDVKITSKSYESLD